MELTNLPQISIEKVSKCSECGSIDLIRDYEAGELVCEHCGTVITSKILNHSPEWRAFNIEQRQNRPRVGAPYTWTIHDKGLSTIIDWSGRDIHGKKLKPERRAQTYRLRKWNRRSKVSGSRQRNLAYALSDITMIAYKLNLPKNVLETAAMIYRQLVRKRLIRGRSVKGIAAASLYMSCRKCDLIRTLEEVGVAASISKKETARNYRFLLRKLKTQVPQVKVKNYIARFVNHHSLSGNVENIAMQIIKVVTELRLTSGRGPAGIAAATTYIACILCDERLTQGEIARGAKVTEVTIRNRYKEIAKKLIFEIDL